MILALLIVHLIVGVGLISGDRRLGRRAFAWAAVAPASMLLWTGAQISSVLDGDVVEQRVAWVPGLGLALDLRLDAFAMVMIGLVSGIGLLVCVYAVGYFSHAGPGTPRLAGLMTVFAGSMLGVVTADHIFALFVFWELTSVTSYLLIGNDDKDPRARGAALQAFLITGAGGLCLLAGFLLIAADTGTFRLSEMVAEPLSTTSGRVGLLLVLVGAFTKSAQIPFAGWLPNAMVAPTPISAYLHAATMVKAGVYLVARLAPLFVLTEGWRPVVIVVGAVTMIVGGWRALRQTDLKLLLAHGTVSQLGFMMVLFGAGEYALGQAGVVLLIAHGAFKAALFMVVGIVDHQVGTRDVRRLHGFGRSWWPVLAVAAIGAASMAGFPPVVGFIAKEKALDALGHAEFIGSGWTTVAIVFGSILTFAYSGRFLLGVLGRFGVDREPRVAIRAAPPAPLFLAPAVVLAAITVAAGLAPVLVDDTVRTATTALYPGSSPAAVKLWAGFNEALLLSAVIIAVGLVLVVARRRVATLHRVVTAQTGRIPTSDTVFWDSIRGLNAVARRVTAVVQNGSLPVYLAVILTTAAVGSLVPLIGELEEWPDLVDSPIHIPIAAGIVVAALGATLVHRRIAAALMLGAVGYGMAGFYVVQGAPDLALTQFAIETLATVLFVLVLRFLPRRFVDHVPAIKRPIRLVVSGLVGVSVFVFALVASGARPDVAEPSISEEMLERSVPDGKGSNVVNVILVDFRGADTLGEITVLVVAAIGTVMLARSTLRRPEDMAGGSIERLPIVDLTSRLLFASILVLSVYFLFVGHNQPGGGFVGGLTAGAAISLRYVAGGVSSVRNSMRLAPTTILGGGLLVAITTALVPLALGESLLEHASFEWDLPILGTVKATSALPFDIGVYFVVLGLVLMAYEAFGDDASPDVNEAVASPAP